MFDLKRNDGNSAYIAGIENYKVTDPELLHLRHMTDMEYNAVPALFKDKRRLFFTAPGMWVIGGGVFAVLNLWYCMKMFMENDPDRWMILLIYSMLDLFVMSIAVLAVFAKMDKYVSRDSLVAAGEITEMTIIRGSKGGVAGGWHKIALHGNREITTIRDNPPINSGSTVLVIKSPRAVLHLMEIPRTAVDFELAETDFSAEIEAAGNAPAYDYRSFDKVGFYQAERHQVLGGEYSELPAGFRTPNLLGHGKTSLFWVIFTSLTIVLIALMAKYFREGYLEGFVVSLGFLICEFILEYLLTKEVLVTMLPKNRTFRIDCVPIEKTSNAGHLCISAVIPEKQQYIDRIEIDDTQFSAVEVGIPVSLYFDPMVPVIKYVHSRYD